MKGLLVILFVASSFPITSFAMRGAVRPPVKTPVKTAPIVEPAFKPAPLKTVGVCGPTCTTGLKGLVSRSEIRTYNQTQFNAEQAVTAGKVLEALPKVAALTREYTSAQNSNNIVSGLFGAIVTSTRNGWDTATRSEINGFVNQVITDGPEVHTEKLMAIAEECAL